MVAACGTWRFGLQVVGLVWSCRLCVLFVDFGRAGYERFTHIEDRIAPDQQSTSNYVVVSLQARSQSYGKRLLASSCLSVRPHGTTHLPLDGFS